MPFSGKKILMVRLGAIGDVIRTLPALDALKKNFPASHIAWIVEEKSESILAGHPQLDELIIIQRKKWAANILNTSTFFPTIKEVLLFIKELREKRFDLVLDFHGIFKSGLTGFLSGASQRFGFTRKFTKEINFLFNNYHIDLPSEQMNRVERNIFLLRQMGISPDPHRSQAVFPLFDEEKEGIDTFFRQSLDPGRKPIIVIHAGSSDGTEYKRWAPTKYARLADALIENYNGEVIFTWGGSEIKTVQEITNMMKNDPIIACPTSLRQLVHLIKRCDLYIGGDTAPMHIAAFSHVPVVAIFGPTDPVINAPFGDNSSFIVRKDLPCSPCRNRKCKTRECTKKISPDEVFTAAKNLISRIQTKGNQEKIYAD